MTNRGDGEAAPATGNGYARTVSAAGILAALERSAGGAARPGGAASSRPRLAEEPGGGLTIAEFAAWARVDRRRVSQHLVEIPPGPVPALPPGKVPCRLIGGTRRIFIADFRGDPSSIGVRSGNNHQEAPPGAAEPTSPWAGQVARLRRR